MIIWPHLAARRLGVIVFGLMAGVQLRPRTKQQRPQRQPVDTATEFESEMASGLKLKWCRLGIGAGVCKMEQ